MNAILAQRKWYVSVNTELNCLVGESRSKRKLFGILAGLRNDGDRVPLLDEVKQTVTQIASGNRQGIIFEVFVPHYATWHRLPRSISKVTLSWFQWQPDEKTGVRLTRIPRSSASGSNAIEATATATTKLLGRLAWLLKHFDQTEEPLQSTYNAALRLWAETDKNGTPDAILPKSVRRELREKVDALIDSSREALFEKLIDPSSARLTSGAIGEAVRLRLTTVTKFGVRSRLFDGSPVESPKASEPLSCLEVVTNLTRPNRDPEAVEVADQGYELRLWSALKVVVAAAASSLDAQTKAEKQRVTDMLQVGTAMLEHAGDDLPVTATTRDVRRQNKLTAALVSASLQRSKKADK